MTTQYNTLRELDVRQGDVVRWRHGQEYKIFGWKDGKCYHFGNDGFPCSVELDAAMRGWSIVSRAPDMIPRAQTDAMVAAALMRAVDLVWKRSGPTLSKEVRALIDAPADAALTKMLAEAKAEGMREAAAVKNDGRYGDDWLGMTAAILAAAGAIQKEGGK